MEEQAHPKPKGTIAVLVIFALLIVVLWGTVYITLLLRGTAE
jgi:Cytochrome c oxidase subunit IIa family